MKEEKTIFSVCSGEAAKISRWFWAEEAWLPGNITWKEYYSLPSLYNLTKLIWYSLALAVVFIIVRFLCERFAFVPLAASLGIHKPRVRKLTPNPILEDACKRNSPKTFKNVEIQVLAKELSWTERQVERWFRDRRRQSVIPLQQKFVESMWRFTVYSFMVIYGYLAMRNKPYFTDSRLSYKDPRNKVTLPELEWYGFLYGGLYFSLLASAFSDVKRKDFTMMLVHHFSSLSVEYAMWFSHTPESGYLIVLCHDIGDIFLEAAKLATYLKKDRISIILWLVFFLVWCLTRLYILPFWLVKAFVTDSTVNAGPLPYMVLTILFSTLLVMHVIWTWMIIKILKRAFVDNSVGDSRSDSEEELSSSEDEKHKAS